MNFTTEKSDENPYYLGYEWDEADEVMEQDILDARLAAGYPIGISYLPSLCVLALPYCPSLFAIHTTQFHFSAGSID